MKNRFHNLLPLAGYFLFMLLSYSYILGMPALASKLVMISYIWVLFVTQKVFLCNKVKSLDKFLLVTLACLSIINVFINSLFFNTNLNFSYYNKPIMFVSSMIWIIYCKYTTISRKVFIYIYVFFILISLCAIYNVSNGYAFEENGMFLIYHFTNTNHTGMFLAICTIYLFSGFFIFTNKIYRILIALFILIMLVLVYMTGCRSALLAIIFVVMMLILDKLKWFILLVEKTKGIFSIFPLLFIFIYMNYIGESNIDVSFGYEDSGKHTGTRVYVWNEILRKFRGYEFCGNYYGISEGTGEFQCLNTHLDVLVSYGIFPLVLFIILLYQSVLKFKLIECNSFQRFGVYAYMSCFIIGTFEAGLVAGSSGLFIAAFGFLLLSSSKEI